jgi:hypothetical protein
LGGPEGFVAVTSHCLYIGSFGYAYFLAIFLRDLDLYPKGARYVPAAEESSVEVGVVLLSDVTRSEGGIKFVLHNIGLLSDTFFKNIHSKVFIQTVNNYVVGFLLFLWHKL